MQIPSTLKPNEVATALVESGIVKHKTRIDVIFFKAVLGGVMLSFGGILSHITGGGFAGLTGSNPGLARLMSGFVFPVGLVMVTLQGQELLTSNMMIFPMATMKRVIPWWSLPLNWLFVFSGNLIGSLFVAVVLVKYSGIISTEPYISYIQTFATRKAVTPYWYQIFLRGIGCNWLVCIAVWVSQQGVGARETISKIFAIWIPIWVFVACGYDNVVANMFLIPLGILFGAPAPLTAGYYVWKSLIPSFLGNVVGALCVGLPASYYFLDDYTTATAIGSIEEGHVRDSEDNGLPSKQQ